MPRNTVLSVSKLVWAARWPIVASGGGLTAGANLYSAADDAAETAMGS